MSSELKQGDIVEVNTGFVGTWNNRIFHSYNHNGAINTINFSDEDNFKEQSGIYRIDLICKNSWRKKQLISDEVRDKLKKLIDDGVDLKFRIESEEQSKELQEFLFSLGCSWVVYSKTVSYTKKSVITVINMTVHWLSNIEESNCDKEFDLKTGKIVNDVHDWWKVGNYYFEECKCGFHEITKDHIKRVNDLDFEHVKQAELVPFDFEDDLLGMKIKDKSTETKHIIIRQEFSRVVTSHNSLSYSYLLKHYKQLDGKPCGKFKILE